MSEDTCTHPRNACNECSRLLKLTVLPLIIGVILGPRVERQLRQTLQLGGGDWSSILSEPIAIVVYVIIALLLAAPLVARIVKPRYSALTSPTLQKEDA